MSFKPDCIYHLKVLNVIFYSIDYLYTISFLFHILFSLFISGLKRQTSIHLLYDEVFVQPLSRMLVQSEPHSHMEYVHFEPSPVMVSLGSIKDFYVVRALLPIPQLTSETLKRLQSIAEKYGLKLYPLDYFD